MAVTMYVRDAALHQVGQLEDFTRLDVTPRFNAVGTWSATLDRRLPAAAALREPGAGVRVVHDGVTILSGPVTSRKRDRSEQTDTVTLSGVDDAVWLARRRAHMQPGTSAPPYNVQEFDVRTGRASTVLRAYAGVNAGPAAISPRRVPGLVLGPDLLLGSTVTGRARMQPLLDLLAELGLAGGVGFRLVQDGTSLVFGVYAPADRSSEVKFSEDLQNLAGYSYESLAPEATYVYAGGDGEGTARTWREGSDGAGLATWGRIESFVDRGSTSDPDELAQVIEEELAERSEASSLSISPVDSAQQRFGHDYGLGDRVTVVIDGERIVEHIREVRLAYDPDGPLEIRPQIGTPGRSELLALFRRIRALGRRVGNMERR